MKINKAKLKRQKDFIHKWIKSACRGSLQAVTGFGKTYVAVLIIGSMNKRHPKRTTLVVVPTLHLQNQWNQQIKTHNLKNVTVLVINTAIKMERTCNLLILDEIHNYAATESIKIFSLVTYDFILGLTATMERSDKRDYLLHQYCPVLDTVDLKESLANDYVSKFLVFNLGLTMNKQENEEYEKLNSSFHYHFSQFDHEFSSAMSCMKNETYRESYAYARVRDPKELMIHAVNFNRNMQARKKFLYNLPSKTAMVISLTKEFPLKTITFCETVDFAKDLTKRIPNSVEYHSKVTKKNRKKKLEEFQDKGSKISVLNTAKALDEGFDVTGIEMAIISSGTSTPRQDLQRTGRAIRFQENKISMVINLYVKDTQDERWLHNRQRKNANIIYVNSIDEIKQHMSGTYEPEDVVSHGRYELYKTPIKQ